MDFIEVDVFGVALRYYDEERIDKISWGKWKTIKQTNSFGYKLIRIVNDKKVQVHRVVYKANNLSWDITDTSKNNYIDHKDRCKSNNKISNLQVATQQQNMFNTNAKGYYYRKAMNKYQAMITRDGKQIHLGYFTNECDAYQAYLEAKKIYHKF
jgi:hypothetical protein